MPRAVPVCRAAACVGCESAGMTTPYPLLGQPGDSQRDVRRPTASLHREPRRASTVAGRTAGRRRRICLSAPAGCRLQWAGSVCPAPPAESGTSRFGETHGAQLGCAGGPEAAEGCGGTTPRRARGRYEPRCDRPGYNDWARLAATATAHSRAPPIDTWASERTSCRALVGRSAACATDAEVLS